jgi:ubiquinol-cytochrome c reductase iron-sulfur subunit
MNDQQDKNQPMDSERRNLLIATGGLSAVGAVAFAVPLVSSFAPSEKAKAAGGAVEVDISDIKPGEQKVVEWRGKPVWILRRTPEMTESLKAANDLVADKDSTKPYTMPLPS